MEAGDETLWGPKVGLKRVRTRNAIWNPDQKNVLRGQTIDYVRDTDGLDIDYFPRCGMIRVRKANLEKLAPDAQGDEVWIPFSDCFYGVSK